MPPAQPQEGAQIEARQNWIETHIRSSFRIQEKDLKKLSDSDEYRNCLKQFMEQPDQRTMFVYYTPQNQLICGVTPPPVISKKAMYFLKNKKTKITQENMIQTIMFGDIANQPLESLNSLANDLFLPMLNQNSEKGDKEIVSQFDKFLQNIYVTIGQTEGKTLLPLPAESNRSVTENGNGEANEKEEKEIVHALETAVVTWTNQIKEVLKNGPDKLTKEGTYPGPLAEIDFWESKYTNLLSISNQLNSDAVKRVIEVLENSKSTYITSFIKMIEEVTQATEEAKSNNAALKPLSQYFRAIKFDSPERAEFLALPDIFKKIYILIYVMWIKSPYYNTPERLLVLIREICNDLIEHTAGYIGGKEIFNLEPVEAIDILENALSICGIFKKYYFVFKQRVTDEKHKNQWRIQPNALFHRLDIFLERTRDILELVQLNVMFHKLLSIQIGGTKGSNLTVEVQDINKAFVAEFQKFKEIEYDVLNVDDKRFDETFYEFKLLVKELERKIASILIKAFDDCSTIESSFKVIESFQPLLTREAIQQEVEKKQSDLIVSYKADLKKVQGEFNSMKNEPPTGSNLPPTAGALLWAKGLIDRISAPIDKFQELNPKLLESPEGAEALKNFNNLVLNIREYQKQQYQSWAVNVGSVSEEKLHQFLLKRKEHNQLLVVNFDPALVRLLREVNYVEKLNENNGEESSRLGIPQEALDIFSKAEMYRTQTGGLEIIVNTYNKIIEGLLPVEKPLLQKKLDAIDQLLEKGIKELNWRSEGVDDFINSAMALVSESSVTLETLHKNVESIESILKKWERNPLFERKEQRTLTLKEFDGRYRELKNLCENMIRKGSETIHKKMVESFQSLHNEVEKSSEAWQNYVGHVQAIVQDGIARCIALSIQALRDQLDANFLHKNELNPLLEVSLKLEPVGETKFEAAFSPKIETGKNANTAASSSSLVAIVNNWIDDFYSIATFMPRLDGEQGSYIDDMKQRKEIKDLVKSVNDLMVSGSDVCVQYRNQFVSFAYLWDKDRQKTFEEFLGGSTSNPSVIIATPLSAFDEQIEYYKKVAVQINELPNSETVGWLKVDSRPIKNELIRLCEAWKSMYSNYLTSQVTSTLTDMFGFMDSVEHGIAKKVEPGDVDSLKEVLGYIKDMRLRHETTVGATTQASGEGVPVAKDPKKRNKFEQMQDIVQLLAKHDVQLPDQFQKNLDHGPEMWNSLYAKTLTKREELSPLQDAEAKKMKNQLLSFSERVQEFQRNFNDMAAFQWKSGVKAAYAALDKWQQLLVDMEKEATNYRLLQQLFELAPMDFKQLKTCREEIVMLKTMWDMSSHVLALFQDWMKTSFKRVDVDTLVEETKQLKKIISAFNANMKSWDSYSGLFNTVNNMLTSLPLVQDLRSPAMRTRHWDQLLVETHKKGTADPEDDAFSLEQLLALGLHNYVDVVRGIVDKASKELGIESILSKIETTWEGLNFRFKEHEELKCVIMDTVEDIIEVLEDNLVKLQNMSSMRYIEFFIERLTKWQTTLATVESVTSLWVEVQKTWANLYPIFVLSEDIRTQLPEDSRRFEGADKRWRAMMNVAKDVTKVTRACTEDVIKQRLDSSDGMYEMLTSMMEDLEKCQKSLADYLETKRRAFPRFYFVAPKDLVDILSKGSFPKQVMNHMSKLVEAINTLEFEEDSNVALKMISQEEEVVEFTTPYECKGAVENWLNGVLDTIRNTLQTILVDAHTGYVEQSRDQWLFLFPAQIVISASRVWFTAEVNAAFERQEEGNKNALKDYLKVCVDQLAKLTLLVQGKLTSGDRKKIITLITVDVHNRDIVAKLIDEKAENAAVFTWQSQLRYMLDETKGCTILIADAEFTYNYEYVGNCGCLVITPLTDRCYITLTQSLRLNMGGAPAGPAGTGKTETTKDLGRALGTAVYVFNCTEQMDYMSLGNIFKGLAMTGAWGCFDEFNRIRIGVLSVVATQFKSIIDAIKAKKDEFEFQHENITLKRTCGVFITMNPGYKGRTELPENLKALFRPCAMIVPDLMNICEIMLAAEGFIEAKGLAKKFVTLYQLNRELLSKQDHYDWGLRAIKSVLVIAGSLKRAEPEVSEEKILMRALRDTNLAKLSRDDVEIFKRLISDLFPKIEILAKKDPELEKCLKQATHELHLQTGENDIFIDKVVQFKELLDVRHSVFVLGPAGSGKSCVWKVLSGAFQLMDKKTQYQVMDPKAVTSFELYGYMHPVTRDWKDGLLSNFMREFSKSAHKNPKWLILDGDIDAEWIESMNTVMDDNKVLTLASNERIPLTPTMRMIFEISHLKNATPATVSRAGILFLNETDIGWAPFKESWIETREDDREKQTLERLFEKYAAPVLEWLKGRVKHIIPVSDINMIQTLCYILEGLLKPELCPPGSANDIYEHYFVFACVWAFGGALPPEDRQAFNSFFKKTFTTVKFPENNQSTVNWTVFDHYVMPEGNKLGHWQELVPVYTHDPELPFGEIVVNTVDTVRTSFVMNLLANNKKPVLLVGTAGTGKTTVIKEKLNKLDEDTIFMSINFNSNTDSLSLQAILEQKLEKKAGTRMGPPGRKGLIYFIDDLNMPNPDKYGTQSAIALLRQHMDYGYWFDRAKMTTRPVSSVQYLAAMNPKAGSFTVDDRFQRHFGTLCCSYPSPSDLTIIFRSIISGHLQQFTKPVRELASKLVQATIELHSKVSKEFLPTAVKFHYQFNLREISNIFQGLCLAQPAYYKEPLDLIKLWLHESYRVFSDRMMVEEDVQKFAGIIAGVGKARFELDNNNAEILTNAHSLLFTSFMTTTSSNEPIYTIVNDFNELKIMLQRKLEEYNNDNAAMNLELFQQAIQHVCRISRILFNPRGNALLVGVGGSGKQSLARLASFINNYEIAQITVTSSYSILDFKAFLINLYKRAGLKGQDFTFLLTDSQIVDEKMLVFVNDMLSSGYIPELFPDDEKLNICGSIQNEVKGLGKDTGADSCWAYFLEKVRSKLHVVLCFSPVGEQFRTWCRKFPAIINCTAIDWFHAWPNEALISVAARFLKDIELGGPEMTEQIAQHMAYVHQTVTQACVEFKMVERRHNYTTPKSFLELISIYKLLLNKKREELNEKIERLSNGLNKLRSSSAKVKDLQVTLKDEQVIVEEKKLATDELVKKVGKERNIVEQQSSVATEEERKTNIIVREVEQFEADCRKELEAAEPIVEKAIAALNTLDKKDLQELKSFSTPSEDVAMVCNTVMFLTAQKTIPRNPTWNDAKKMMANPTQFLDDLKKFDKENIPQANIDAVKPYLDEVKYPNFNFEAIKSKSSAAAGLCSWVINICKFDAINKQVEPKRQQLRAAQEKLEASKASLKKIQDKVKELQNKLALLMAEYEAANQEKLANEERAKRTQDKLNLAERLVNGLADENVRWANSINDLKIRDQTLVGDVLLAGAFLSYVGAFTKSYRLSFLDEKWLPDLKARKIPTTEGIDPLYGVLTEDAQVAQWNNEGLPSDRVSIENGAIVTNCSRWPLMIDPQLQAIKWIKNRESKNNLQIIQLNQKRYLEVVENAIYNGYPCIIENIGENIDSVLDPLLSRSFTKRNRTTFIKLGEKEVEYDERFKLYLQTKLSNPHYRPEIVAQTTLLNFIVTDQGLEDQLLATTVNKERPDLEVLRASYMKQLRQFKIELKECEDNLLFELSNAKGDILENKKLIENLEMTKEKSKQITISVVEIEENNKKIDVSRQVYRPVSVRGSMLYFLIDQLSNLDHMYQYSLEAFMVVFGKALDKAKAADTVDERVANITDSITETLFSYVSRGLFERHKLIFSTMLCFGILRKQNDIDANQLEFLLRGPKRFGEERPETVAGWCSEASWAAVKALTEIEANTTPAFSTLPADMAGSWRRWKEWCEFEKPEEKPLPLEWKNLEPFQKLLIIRCLRPDRLTWSVTNFVGSKIGTKYVVQAPMDLADSYVDAGPTTPIFFILSPGVDPVKSVESLGETLGFTESAGKLKNVSLGQGQEPIAEEGLEMAFRNGGWVILNNLHLTPEWLVILEKKLDHYAEVFARQRAAAAKKEEGRLAAAALANKTTTEGEEEKPAEEAEATTEGGEEQKKEPVEETQAPVNEKVEEKHDESDDEDDHDDKGHNDFRVFLSAEPSPKIPLGILQRSIKLTNEPPSGLRANLLRAFMQFNDSVWEASTKQTEFKGILFSLCFFHAVIVERKKFGPQGWNRNYPFSLGDLTTCIAVLNNYLEDRPKVPWEDLRYVFGEIMYGGHITDDWDRRLCSTYFAEYIRAEIVETIQLCPGFQSPPANLSYQGYIEYIDTQLPSESPTAFGLHPNAEIGFRTQQGESLFRMIVEMQPRSSSGGEGMSATDKVAQEIANILDRLPEQYNLGDIVERLDVGEERTPFQNSFYQECEYMNRLLDKLEKSLKELKSGLDGELTISDRMQSLMDSLSNNKVPESWAAVAYPSLRPLDTWVTNLLERCAQLTAWTQDLTQPKVVWLSGLFNPQSFLTAIMQSTARKMQWPLDKMTLVAEVTKKMRAEEIDVGAREGAYVSGFFLEGATWDEKKNSLVESKLKELYPKMPIIHIKAMQVEKSDPKAYFDCPCYKTMDRGPDYVFCCKLKTKDPPSKWILGGVAMLLDVVE